MFFIRLDINILACAACERDFVAGHRFFFGILRILLERNKDAQKLWRPLRSRQC